MPAPSVFISYSHADEVWKDRLAKHLGVLEAQGLLGTWDDRKIRAGDEWLDEIRSGMDGARVAVLLISANSLTSKFILNTEVPHLLEKRAEAGLTFFPVICRDCLWQEIPWLVKLQARPRDGKPLESFRGGRLNTELAKIAKEILEIARDGSPGSRLIAQAVKTVGPVLPVLHQLPSPPADFTGRDKDLAALSSAHSQGRRILGLFGTGGVGKTALALRLAEELTREYPDAQFYVDLKGVDPHPLSAAQAMAHVIRSCHPEVRLPENEADLAGLYRSVLYGKRTLLLLDNAASREHVEPLLPPKDSLLLMTSRFHFTLPGLVARDLDELPAADARDLLLKIAPRIGVGADAIARLCGRLPLALRLASSALAERPDLSPSDYHRRLREGKERFGEVEAALTISYELLKEDRRRLWRLLAVFPGTFAAPAATAVWELDADPASEALGELVRCSLVEWEEKEERYRLHDLARSFANGRIEETEREAAQRYAEYFLKLLQAANDLYLKGGEFLAQALRLFDAEWSNIQAGFAWASERSLGDETAARICDDYPHAAPLLLELRQHPKERLRWREFALSVARQRKNARSEASHLCNLGRAHADLGDLRRAIEYCEQALAIACETGDWQREAWASWHLGLAIEKEGDLARATDLMQVLVDYQHEIGHPDAEKHAAEVAALRARIAEQGS
jgi:tetratricopeptide (TPR) repeat protein